MARREWALKIVGKQVFHDRRCGPIVNFPRAVKLVKTEHARAVRIVNRKMKELLSIASGTTDHRARLVNDAQIAVVHEIETALTKGRT